MQQQSAKCQVDKLINEAWKNHDKALAAGLEGVAEAWKAEAFELLSRLPENEVYLKLQH